MLRVRATDAARPLAAVATLGRIARALRADDEEAHAPLDARLALIACVFAAELSAGAAIRRAMRSRERPARERLDLRPGAR